MKGSVYRCPQCGHMGREPLKCPTCGMRGEFYDDHSIFCLRCRNFFVTVPPACEDCGTALATETVRFMRW